MTPEPNGVDHTRDDRRVRLVDGGSVGGGRTRRHPHRTGVARPFLRYQLEVASPEEQPWLGRLEASQVRTRPGRAGVGAWRDPGGTGGPD